MHLKKVLLVESRVFEQLQCSQIILRLLSDFLWQVAQQGVGSGGSSVITFRESAALCDVIIGHWSTVTVQPSEFTHAEGTLCVW